MNRRMVLVGLGLFFMVQDAAAQEQMQTATPLPGGIPGMGMPRRPTCSARFRGDAAKIEMCEEMSQQDNALMAEQVAFKGERVKAAKTARTVRRANTVLERIFPRASDSANFQISALASITHQYEGLLPGQSTVNIRAGAMFRAMLAQFNGAVWFRTAVEFPTPALAGLFRDPEPSTAMMEGQMPAMMPGGGANPTGMMGQISPVLTAEQQTLIKKMDRTVLDLSGGVELRILGYDLAGTGYWQGIGILAGLGGWINPGSLYWEAGTTFNLKWFSIRADFQGPLWGVWKDLGGGKKVGVNLVIPLFSM